MSDTKKNDDNFQKVCDEIGIDELRECINLLKKNKSPGNDGLTGEFYKTFSFDSKLFAMIFARRIKHGLEKISPVLCKVVILEIILD